jgi:lysozyme
MTIYKTSQRGIDAIKQYEGFSAVSYSDVAGKQTIGYGHLITAGEKLLHLSEDEAEGLLRADLALAEKAVSDLVLTPLSQCEFDALVSFVFNLGRNAFKNSTMLRLLNKGDLDAAAQQFERWNQAGGNVVAGLTRRRRMERAMFEGIFT